MLCQKCGKEISEGATCECASTMTVKKKSKLKTLLLLSPFIAVAVIVVLLSFGGDEGTESSVAESPKVIQSGDNIVFDITYADFCLEMSEVFSAITGATEEDFITYCNKIPAYNTTLDSYSGNLIRYEIGLEASEFSNALFVLKVEVYVEPETQKVVTVSVFKVNGSSTLDNFNMLANKASLILCGRMVSEMEDCLIKTIDKEWEQLHYFEYDGCGMEFEQQKSGFGGGDLRRLLIYPAESSEIPE